MPEYLEDVWPCYVLVVDQHASWTEVSSTMSIDDVDMLCTAVNIVFDARIPEGR